MKNLTKDSQLLAILHRVGVQVPEIIELFDYLEDRPLWMKDVDGHYQWVNYPFLLNYGLKSRAEVIGLTDFDLCGTVLANQYRFDDEEVLGGERILSRVELVGRFDHTARWCVTSKIPLRDTRGKIVGTAGVTSPLNRQRTEAPANSPLSAAIRFISEHYSEPIANPKLAEMSGMSVRAFERQFFGVYRRSPHNYIRELRVRMSCSALVYSSRSLADVAAEFGFADQSHFSREFRRLMGETPSAYRSRFQH